MDRGSGAALGGGSRRVEQRGQRSFHEVNVGDPIHFFLSERLFKLADLHLELSSRLDVEVKIAEADTVTGSGVNQESKVVLRTVTALKTEARTSDDKSIGGGAVPLVSSIVGLDISVGLKLKFPISTLDEEVLAVPAGNYRSAAILFLGLVGLVALDGPAGGLGQSGIYR